MTKDIYIPKTIEERKAYNAAIDRVLELLAEQASNLENVSKMSKFKSFHFKSLALLDFGLLIERLFKAEARHE